MKYSPRTWTVAFLIVFTAGTWCAAQNVSDNGMGYAPMAPPTSWSAPSNLVPSTVPDAPARPTNPSRPATWPGGAASATAPATPSDSVVPLPPLDRLTPCDNARILGHVGSEVILMGDVAAVVNEIIEANKDRIPPGELDATREIIIKKHLKNVIQNKLVYLDAKKKIPSENWPLVESQIDKAFDEEELPKIMKRTGAASRSELEAKLAAVGSSIERERRAFRERTLAQQWVRQQIKRDEEITYDQMVRYYREHLDEFTKPARAKWEELMVRFSNYPNKAAAYDAIARLGNHVLNGISLAAIAREASDGVTADQGGVWDWTAKGSLVCKEIDQALFSLPIGQLSPIIEGPQGFHIVRVIEREEAATAPFLEAQVEIREKIIKQRSEKQLRDYLAKLEAKTPVSTIYDGEGDAGRQKLSERSRPPLR